MDADIYVKEAETARQMHDFAALPRSIYRGCAQYVPEMESDVKAMFRPESNPSLLHSEAQPFVAYNADGQPVGRVAAIINHRANEKFSTTNVRFSEIEFIDNPDVCRSLLLAVEQWGKERGMTAIQGPLGFTDMDREGMLVEDFHLPGAMTSIYNHPYYPRHIEALGFEKEADWVQVRVAVPKEIPPRFERVSKLCAEMFGLTVRTPRRDDFRRQGLGRRLFRLLNEAYAPLFAFTELTEKEIDAYVERYLPLVDLRMLPIVENAQGELVAMAITMGSLAGALRKAGGRMLPLGWLHLLKAIKWKREDTVEMLLIAVRPDYQGKGVNALIFTNLIPTYNTLGFRYAETGPQLESNARELMQWKLFDPQVVKRRRCYRKDI